MCSASPIKPFHAIWTWAVRSASPRAVGERTCILILLVSQHSLKICFLSLRHRRTIAIKAGRHRTARSDGTCQSSTRDGARGRHRQSDGGVPTVSCGDRWQRTGAHDAQDNSGLVSWLGRSRREAEAHFARLNPFGTSVSLFYRSCNLLVVPSILPHRLLRCVAHSKRLRLSNRFAAEGFRA